MKTKIILPILLLFAIAGCGVYTNVYSDYDKTIDFNKYKTFAWLPDKDTSDTQYNNQIIRNNTINYFSHCMGLRGMKANIDTPDIFLELVIVSVKKQTTVTTPLYSTTPTYQANPYYYPYPNTYYYHSPYYYNYSYGSITKKVEYVESTIALNVIDRKQNKLVWKGAAEGDLYDPEYIKDNLHPAVYDILNYYPIKPIVKHTKPKN